MYKKKDLLCSSSHETRATHHTACPLRRHVHTVIFCWECPVRLVRGAEQPFNLCLCVCSRLIQFTHTPTRQPTHPSIHLSIHPSVRPFHPRLALSGNHAEIQLQALVLKTSVFHFEWLSRQIHNHVSSGVQRQRCNINTEFISFSVCPLACAKDRKNQLTILR